MKNPFWVGLNKKNLDEHYQTTYRTCLSTKVYRIRRVWCGVLCNKQWCAARVCVHENKVYEPRSSTRALGRPRPSPSQRKPGLGQKSRDECAHSAKLCMECEDHCLLRRPAVIPWDGCLLRRFVAAMQKRGARTGRDDTNYGCTSRRLRSACQLWATPAARPFANATGLAKIRSL